VLAGLFLGIQILGGFPQIAFYTILAIILFGTYHIGIKLRHGERGTIFGLCGMLIIPLLAFSLAAVQLLPTYEFTQLSTRSGGVTYEFATIDSFDPVNFITFLMPNFFGNPVNGSQWKASHSWQFWELCAYVGIGPLVLLCFLKKNIETRHVRTFFVLLLLLSLFLSLGRYNPLYRFLYHLPGFNHFRIPAQILYLYIFSLSILGGMGLTGLGQCQFYSRSHKMMVVIGLLCFGLFTLTFLLWPVHFYYYLFKITEPSALTLDSVSRVHGTVRLALFTGAGLFTLIVALIHLRFKHRLGPTSVIVALLLVSLADLWSFSNPFVRTTDLSLSPEKTDLSKSLYSDPEICRVVTMGRVFGPNEGVLYGYQDIQGYDPLILKRYLEYINKSQNVHMAPEAVNVRYVTQLDNHLIRMLNVKYAISDNTGVLRLKHHMPRAFVVHKAVTLPKEKILEFMMSEDFNPTEMVILEDAPQAKKLIQHNIGRGGDHEVGHKVLDAGFERCQITEYRNSQIVVTVNMAYDGYLVLSEINYPGWTAYVDGVKTEVLTGNYIFRVVPASKGSHKITMKFQPRSFKIGLIVTGATALFFLLSPLWLFIRRKR
jgi:hypothetical protein